MESLHNLNELQFEELIDHYLRLRNPRDQQLYSVPESAGGGSAYLGVPLSRSRTYSSDSECQDSPSAQASTETRNDWKEIAKRLRDISKDFEKTNRSNQQNTNLEGSSSHYENDLQNDLQQQLHGQIDAMAIANILIRHCISETNLEIVYGYITDNSNGLSQIAMSLELLTALHMIMGLNQSFSSIKKKFANFFARRSQSDENLL